MQKDNDISLIYIKSITKDYDSFYLDVKLSISELTSVT